MPYIFTYYCNSSFKCMLRVWQVIASPLLDILIPACNAGDSTYQEGLNAYSRWTEPLICMQLRLRYLLFIPWLPTSRSYFHAKFTLQRKVCAVVQSWRPFHRLNPLFPPPPFPSLFCAWRSNPAGMTCIGEAPAGHNTRGGQAQTPCRILLCCSTVYLSHNCGVVPYCITTKWSDAYTRHKNVGQSGLDIWHLNASKNGVCKKGKLPQWRKQSLNRLVLPQNIYIYYILKNCRKYGLDYLTLARYWIYKGGVLTESSSPHLLLPSRQWRNLMVSHLNQ